MKTMKTSLIVMAKEPLPGRCKTRMSPPCTPEEAAAVAQAALTDTLSAAIGCSRATTILALDGRPGRWLPAGIRVIRQRGKDFGERLQHALADVGGSALIIGMDTPQVTSSLLDDSIDALLWTDSVLGRAEDGGWWALGVRNYHEGLFTGVPMSTPMTGDRQNARLRALGLTVAALPSLRDADTFDDAIQIGALAPESAFARSVRRIEARLGAPAGVS